jgi:hypothetical protein
MTNINKAQIAAFHALLKQHGITDQKADIVQQLSNGRVTSTKDLYSEEIQPWIIAMNNNKAAGKAEDKPGDKMIRSIIAMAREMGIITRHQVVTVNGLEWKSNYTRFNEWLLTKSTAKKANLNLCSYEELNNLVTQYKAIYTSWLHKHH